MEDGAGALIALGIVLFVLYLVVVVLFYVAIVFAAVGAAYGLIMAVINFVRSIVDVVKYRSAMGTYKNEEVLAEMEPILHSPDKFEGRTDISYEEIARPSYLLGPCFKDVIQIIKGAFAHNFESMPEFGRGESWWTMILFFIYAFVKLIAMYVLGTIFTLGLSVILSGIFLGVMIIIYPIMGIVYLGEKIYFARKRISYRCPKCKNEYVLPVYACPTCKIRHTHLKPGRYGVFKRKCVCGTILPLTVKSKGRRIVSDYASGTVRKEKVRLAEMDMFCPECNTSYNAGLSHSICIALIGGASAGKTTFKTAFLNDFITDELTKYNIDYDFPNDKISREYKEIEGYYKGRPIPATTGGVDTDIQSFSFFLKNKGLDVDRMVQLYDMPGEVFQSGQAKEGWETYTIKEGAVFLLDPYTLSKVREENEQELNGATMGISSMKMDSLIESLIGTMESVRAKTSKSHRFLLPIALTINKADTPMLKKQVGDEAIQALMKTHPDVFTEYYATMDYVCRCFLAQKEGRGFIANLDNHFETVHFFSSSPMGFVPKGVMSRFHPINVLPIMQWMMLRADKQLGKVWRPALPVPDVTDEQRSLYQTHPEYYEEYMNSVGA